MEPRAVGVSKQDIREQIWGYMESQNLADFPRPVHHRIPNFKSKKTLLVPTPRLRTGLFNKITPPPGATKDILRKCATSQVPPERLGRQDRISKTCSIGNCLTSSKV
ncbi:MTHFSD isoform 13 [Pan troglodytes]|uniref:Methenyltetrahydrofolate synthetase domain containing n=4 Tax=Homininae TaxID=207598 RepID=H3BPD2_HUMAN|nr:methenyltetrahydrofolate synthetase domain containing [Homo sapiens]KAI4056406.1 methenyltetrahydrofolate synthetase domain containing [Homo sapiens]PNI45857.1 MTHFSD isoform 13 [Pan troglodytes]